jgi:hypothetical protein
MAIRKPTSRKPAKRVSKPKRQLSIFEKIEALGRAIPAEEQAGHPRDGARNLHHYLHGAAKQDPD